MSNLCNQTSTLSKTARIVENESRIKLSRLQWSSFEQRIKERKLWINLKI